MSPFACVKVQQIYGFDRINLFFRNKFLVERKEIMRVKVILFAWVKPIVCI